MAGLRFVREGVVGVVSLFLAQRAGSLVCLFAHFPALQPLPLQPLPLGPPPLSPRPLTRPPSPSFDEEAGVTAPVLTVQHYATPTHLPSPSLPTHPPPPEPPAWMMRVVSPPRCSLSSIAACTPLRRRASQRATAAASGSCPTTGEMVLWLTAVML